MRINTYGETTQWDSRKTVSTCLRGAAKTFSTCFRRVMIIFTITKHFNPFHAIIVDSSLMKTLEELWSGVTAACRYSRRYNYTADCHSLHRLVKQPLLKQYIVLVNVVNYNYTALVVCALVGIQNERCMQSCDICNIIKSGNKSFSH